MNGDVTGSHIPLDPVENRQSRVIRQANVQDDGVREILPRHEHTFIGGFGNEALESCFMRKVAENPREGSIVLHNEDYPAVPGQLLSVILDGWRFPLSGSRSIAEATGTLNRCADSEIGRASWRERGLQYE